VSVDVQARVLAALRQIAPEIEPSEVSPQSRLQEDLELDSYDLLRLLTALGREFQVEIPESDYGQLRTVGGLVAYLQRTGRP
jgi:acyl carrier protein